MPTWQCIPKIKFDRAASCNSLTMVWYRGSSVMGWSCHFEKGCVPAPPTIKPCLSAKSTMTDLKDLISVSASLTFLQILVPTSTTDWCISALTCSFNIVLAPSTILDKWDRKSLVFGSIIWYSSSTPSVKTGNFFILN